MFRALALILPLAACASGSTVDFARWDANLRAAGKLRADRAPIDAPFSRADLVDAFRKIGFGSEFEIVDGAYVPMAQDAAAPLTRWQGPLRYTIIGRFAEDDRDAVARFSTRLSETTGLSIAKAKNDPNLLIFFLDPDGRQEVAQFMEAEPQYHPLLDLYSAWRADAKWPCAAEFYYEPPHGPGAYEIYFAVVYIRAEVSGISRRSCIEEEIAQTLGLARDDPSLRPSIFNDDEEFALMTEHDAALLQVLYDPRLSPGMTMAEAMPIVERIVEDLPLP